MMSDEKRRQKSSKKEEEKEKSFRSVQLYVTKLFNPSSIHAIHVL